MPKTSVIKLLNYFKSSKSIINRLTTPYKKSENFGIFIHLKEIKNSSAINTFVEKLKSDGKKVSIICYSDSSLSVQFEFACEVFTNKDISLTGKYLNTEVDKFSQQNFDYLFCLSTEFNPVVTKVLLESQAKCRAGLQTENSVKMLDLMIYSENTQITPKEIGEQILALIKKINTND